MRRSIDAVEIKEPPIREFEKKNSCLKRTCVVGCGGIVLFMIVTIFLFWYITRSRTKELAELPNHFPANVPVYDEKNIDRIIYSSGEARSRVIERLALLPKLFLSLSTLFQTDPNHPAANAWDRFSLSIGEPVTNPYDHIEIEWTQLSAQPKFIQNFYQTSLLKEAFVVTIASETDEVRQFTFNKNDITGALYIRDNPANNGTDFIKLTIQIPSKDL